VNAQGDTPPKFLLGRVAATKNALKQIPIAVNEQSVSIWSKLWERPQLSRVLKANRDLEERIRMYLKYANARSCLCNPPETQPAPAAA
jgi:hypothetical protein